jgi:Protein of unknown function (DUF3052)
MPGYSGTPLAQKLGIKSGCRITVVHEPDDYKSWLAPLPAGVAFDARPGAATDIVHLFTRDKAELWKRLTTYRAKLKPGAMVWVSWPKKASKIATDVTEDTIRDLALPMGFVDVKVCAVSDVWSGLKLVVRKALR